MIWVLQESVYSDNWNLAFLTVGLSWRNDGDYKSVQWQWIAETFPVSYISFSGKQTNDKYWWCGPCCGIRTAEPEYWLVAGIN